MVIRVIIIYWASPIAQLSLKFIAESFVIIFQIPIHHDKYPSLHLGLFDEPGIVRPK